MVPGLPQGFGKGMHVNLRSFGVAISLLAAIAALVLLQACTPTAVNPTQPLELGPGEGYAAIQLDLHEPNRELLFASSVTGQNIQIDNVPAGKSLYLFAVPAGHYCMSMFFIVGEQRIYPHDLKCFDVLPGKLAFTGYLSPAVIYGNIEVGQIRDDAAGQAELRKLYPQIATQFFGPAPDVVPPSAVTTIQTSPVNGCYADEPAEVALTGTLNEGIYRAPPKPHLRGIINHEPNWLYGLNFAQPICTLGNLRQGGVDRPYPEIHVLRLVYGGDDSAFHKLIGQYKGKEVRCTGEIFDMELRITNLTDCVPVPEQNDAAPK